MASGRHKDLEFHVDKVDGSTRVCKTFDEACGLAAAISMSNGRAVNVDVVTWSRAAAVALGGDDAGDVYDEDPDASVFQRIKIKAEDLGRVP